MGAAEFRRFYGYVKLTGAHNLVNSRAPKQLAQAKDLGIGVRGLYHFAADDAQVHTAKEEADWFLKNAEQYLDGNTHFFLDWETHALRLLTPEWALEWLTRTHASTGIVPAIYIMGSEHVNPKYDQIVRAGFPLMHAAYGSNTPGRRAPIRPAASRWPQEALIIDQYSSAGGVPGWSEGLDLDYSHLTLEELKSWAKPRPLVPFQVRPMGYNAIPGTRRTDAIQKFLGILEDNVYGPNTVAHVIGFQEENDLDNDGVWGPKSDKVAFG